MLAFFKCQNIGFIEQLIEIWKISKYWVRMCLNSYEYL